VIAVDERRDTTASTVETVVVQRGTIIIEMWPWGEVDWVASNHRGTEATRAYAIVAGCVALIREGGSGS
jgi:CRP-like cAMP-binding protein